MKLFCYINGVKREQIEGDKKEIQLWFKRKGIQNLITYLSEEKIDELTITTNPELHGIKSVGVSESKILNHSIEYIQCPYCGSRLERVSNKNKCLIPTSCAKCKHHDFIPNEKKMVFVDDLITKN